jgi:phosphate transport system substrate-binding protein
MAALVFALVACGQQQSATSGTLVVAASGPALSLTQEAARAFEAHYPTAHISTRALDGFRATEALLRGDVGLALLDRDVVAEEENAARAAHLTLEATPVAKDGVAVIVNLGNPVERLAVEDLKHIVTGKVRRWLDVGGGIGAIEVILPDPTTGTGGYLSEVLSGQRLPGVRLYYQTADSAVVRLVRTRPDAIGVVSASRLVSAPGSTSGIRVLDISPRVPATSESAVELTQANVADDQYPLSTRLTAVTRGDPAGLAAGFIGFLTSDRGQHVVERLGLAPVSPTSYEIHLR